MLGVLNVRNMEKFLFYLPEVETSVPYFCMVCKLKMIFTFLQGSKKIQNKTAIACDKSSNNKIRMSM
jgi:DNA-directed RNA polymerase subunit RPC12/RpoP